MTDAAVKASDKQNPAGIDRPKTGRISGLAAVVALEKKMDVAQLGPVHWPRMLKIKTE